MRLGITLLFQPLALLAVGALAVTVLIVLMSYGPIVFISAESESYVEYSKS